MRKANADETGIIGLVPDQWGGVFMPRHQVLTRLARRWPVVWLDMPAGWRDYWLPSGSRFLEGRRLLKPYPEFTVLIPGMMRPAI